jgi:uncharacterized coiled-coil protein SlyX
MQELITKSYNGFAIEFEFIDGQLMANATAMCAAFGRRANDWLTTMAAKRYIAALQAKPGIPVLVGTRQGGVSGGGTWVHERLILKLAQWLDVDFEVQCDEWVAELLRTGKVELQRPLSPAELILAQAQQLVDHERRVNDLEVQQAKTSREIEQLDDKVAMVAAKQNTIENNYYSITGYASLLKKRVTSADAKELGKQAATLSRQRNIKIDKVADSKYGSVNAYHMDVLKLVFGAVPSARPARRLAA